MKLRTLITILYSLSGINLFSQTKPQYLPTSGLVAWYPFNGNANDESGNGNNGSVYGATLTADRFGKVGSAYHVDSISTYIGGSCTNFPTVSRTVSLWFSASNIEAPLGKGVFGYGGGACGTSWLEVVDNSLYRVARHCNDDWYSYYWGIIQNNSWHHWIVTTDGATETRFYIDGQLVLDTTNFYNNTSVLGKEFIIGGIPSSQGFGFYTDQNVIGFEGDVDDIGIWNRVLTAHEVGLLYQSRQALYLNGITDYAEIPDNADLDFTDSLTIEAWIRPGDVSGNHNIAGKSWCFQSDYGYNLYIADGKIYFDWSATGNCNFVGYYATDERVTLSTCTHVAVVFSSSEVKIYINGGLVSGSLIAGNYSSIRNSNAPFRIGTYRGLPGNYANFFNGEIDELRVWNRKLSATEINGRMNSTLTGNEPGLVAYYDMEEAGSGSGFIIFNKCLATGSALNAISSGSASTPFHTIRCAPFVFTGTGNWDIATNWFNNLIPPAALPPNSEILINPTGTDSPVCILNVQQTIKPGAKITVQAGKKFRINGNLTIQ